MNLLLIDLPSILHPIFHMSGKEPDPDHTSQQTVARVHQLAAGNEHVAVCCDSPKSVRKELDPSYKANRPATDERLVHQLRLAKEQLRADGFPVWSVEGYEADDVIASAVETAVKAHVQKELSLESATIVSADKDLLQLVDGVVSVLTPSGKTYGPNETAEKFVPPHQMRDYLILVGDSSDNIKGVPGIGDKKAKALLAACDSISGIYDRIRAGKVLDAPFTPSIVTAMNESLMAVELGRKLVQLRDDLEIPFDEILKPRTPAQGDDMQTQVIDNKTGEVHEVPSTPPPAPTPVHNGLLDVKKPADELPTQASVQLATVEWSRELEPRSLQQAERVAKHMFTSRLFAAYGTQEAVLSTILAGRELGVGAMASLRGMHIVEGRPTLSASLMAAMILQSGKAKFFRVTKASDTVATVRTHRIGEDEPQEASFTIEQAKQQKLIKPNSGWEKTPEDMLVARAIARLARRAFPDVCFGLYTAEELNREDLERETEAA